MSATVKVERAIEESVLADCISYVGGLTREECVTVEEMLAAECDDDVQNGTVHEFWGTTDAGREWRVHVDTSAR